VSSATLEEVEEARVMEMTTATATATGPGDLALVQKIPIVSAPSGAAVVPLPENQILHKHMAAR
jgi:hypothetical protein